MRSELLEVPPAPAATGQSDRRRVLAICCLSLFIVGLDATAVNVALPAIGRDLDASVSGLQWTVDAYTVVMASLLMLGGSTGDRLGRRRTFVTGIGVFTLGSLLCSVAPTTELLITARVVQGIGASMLNPVAMSIITNTFTDPRERAQAIGVWAAVFGLSMAAGPVLGGLLVQLIDWRAIFWLNLPVGIAAAALTLKYVPESKAEHARRPDPVGQVLVIGLLAGLTYGIIEGPSAGWGSGEVIGSLALAVLALVTLLAYEPRREEPLLDLRFFRSVPFASAIGTAIAAFAAFGGFLFLNTLYLQQARGYSALDAGLATAPLAIAIALLAPVSGRLVGARGTRLPLVIAGVAGLTGTALMFGVDTSTPLARVLLAYVIFGIGFAFVNAPVTNTAVSGMPRAQAGVAAATTTTSRQVGFGLGVAISGAIVNAALHTTPPGSLSSAIDGAWWLVLGAQAIVLILAFVSTTARARASAERVAAELNPEALAPAPGTASGSAHDGAVGA